MSSLSSSPTISASKETPLPDGLTSTDMGLAARAQIARAQGAELGLALAAELPKLSRQVLRAVFCRLGSILEGYDHSYPHVYLRLALEYCSEALPFESKVTGLEVRLITDTITSLCIGTEEWSAAPNGVSTADSHLAFLAFFRRRKAKIFNDHTPQPWITEPILLGSERLAGGLAALERVTGCKLRLSMYRDDTPPKVVKSWLKPGNDPSRNHEHITELALGLIDYAGESGESLTVTIDTTYTEDMRIRHGISCSQSGLAQAKKLAPLIHNHLQYVIMPACGLDFEFEEQAHGFGMLANCISTTEPNKWHYYLDYPSFAPQHRLVAAAYLLDLMALTFQGQGDWNPERRAPAILLPVVENEDALPIIRYEDQRSFFNRPWLGPLRQLRDGEASFYDPVLDSLRKQWRKPEPVEYMEIFFSVARQLYDQGYLDADGYFTSSLSDVRFVDKDNNVLFECFGHLVCHATRADWLLEQGCFWNADYRKEMSERPFGESPAKLMYNLVGVGHGDEEHHIGYWTAQRHDGYEPDLHLSTLNECRAGQLTPPLALRALREAAIQFCGGVPENFLEALGKLQFTDETNTVRYSGNDLVRIVGQAHFTISFPFSERALVELVRHAPSRPTFEVNDLADALVGNHLTSQEVFYFALCSLGYMADSEESFGVFADRFKKRSETPNGERPTGADLDQLVMNAPTSQIQYDALLFDRISDLVKQFYYRKCNGDVEQILRELREYQNAEVDCRDGRAENLALVRQIKEKVVPELIKTFTEVQAVKSPPEIKLDLRPQQLEGIVGAIHFNRPVLVYGTGTGKTATLAGYCMLADAKQVLYVTRSANVINTAFDLQYKVFRQKRAPTIGTLMPEDLRTSSAEEVRTYLRSHRIVVIGYETITTMAKRRSGSYDALSSWAKTLLLDEFDAADNARTLRSRAIQGLKPDRCVAGSATPVQHRHERIATVLHLTMPERYPDPITLETELKQNPEICGDLLRAHSTMCGIEDIALPFEDPAVRPFEEQLASGPRYPSLITTRVPYQLPIELSRTYADILSNYDQCTANLGLPPSRRLRRTVLENLVFNPEALGLPSNTALVEAVKADVAPYLDRGQKVLILGFRLDPLHALANDSDFQGWGTEFIHGKTTMTQRTLFMHQIERDSNDEDAPNVNCIIGQILAAGTGFQCRSVAHVCVVDLSTVTSVNRQGFGRAIRTLYAQDLRFARQDVTMSILEPTLAPELRGEIADSRLADELFNYNIFRMWNDRMFAKLERLNYLTARGQRKIVSQAPVSITETIREVSKRIEKLPVTNFSASRDAVFGPFVNRVKAHWRAHEYFPFVQANVGRIAKPASELTVAVMPGPTGPEFPFIIDELGVDPKNVYAYESDTGDRHRLVEDTCSRWGVRCVNKSVEDGVLEEGVEFDLLFIDPEGGMSTDYFEMFARVPLGDQAIVLKNSASFRDHAATPLFPYVGGQRHHLQMALIKLTDTAESNPHQPGEAPEMLKLSRLTRRAARSVGGALARTVDADFNECVDFLSEVHLGCRHLAAYHQVEYVTPSGSTYLSSLALLNRWDNAIRESPTVQELRTLMTMMVDNNFQGTSVGSSRQVRAASDGHIITLRPERFGNFRIGQAAFLDALEYFKNSVPAENRFKELLAREPAKLRAA